MSQFPDSGSGWQNYGTMSSSGEGLQGGVDLTSLTNSVASSISSIKNNAAALERTTKIIGTAQDNGEYRDNACDMQKRTNETIQQATADLAHITRLVRGETKQRRLMVDKLTKDFHMIVKTYSESQEKLVRKMRKTFLVAQLDDQNNEPSTEGNAQLMQQQQLQYQLQVDDARLRENQMREIESVVVDVNEIMLNLASQINQQGQHIGTIESNIENVHGNIEQGESELRKAATYQNKYRKKVLILLLIAVVVGVIVTIVVISDVKN